MNDNEVTSYHSCTQQQQQPNKLASCVLSVTSSHVRTSRLVSCGFNLRAQPLATITLTCTAATNELKRPLDGAL